MTITAKIKSKTTISGKIKTNSGGQTDSDHRIVTIGSYNFVAVSVETIETEEE